MASVKSLATKRDVQDHQNELMQPTEGGLSCQLFVIDYGCCRQPLLCSQQPAPAQLPRRNTTPVQQILKSKSATSCLTADRLPLTASSARRRLRTSRRSTQRAASMAGRSDLSHMTTPTARRKRLNKPANSLRATKSC